MKNKKVILFVFSFMFFRYRKFNLFREGGFNVTHSSELCTFDTDFGVRFGMFICFDILFQNPANLVIQEKGVKDVVYSTAWFSEIPLLTGKSIQYIVSHKRYMQSKTNTRRHSHIPTTSVLSDKAHCSCLN